MESNENRKYIDSEKLIASIKRKIESIENCPFQLASFGEEKKSEGELIAYKDALSLIVSLQQEQPIKVYRVENEKEQKGLWRKFDGTWEPLFDMLTDGQCKDMPMEDSPIYREGGKQWFASAPSKETLQKWFSKRDLEELTAKGFTISEFEVVGHKKISDFEYIFTRDSIISRTYLKVSDIYPQEQPEEELTEFEKAIKNMIKPYAKWPDDVFKEESAKLLSLAREQFIKDGYVIEKKAFHDAVENISDKHRAEMSVEYSIHCKVEDGTRHAIMNWEAFQKVAQKFIEIGKAEALKDLPRWENVKIPQTEIAKVWIGALDSFWLQHKNKEILVQSLEKLPGFKEDSHE